jgi:hypothetical protein
MATKLEEELATERGLGGPDEQWAWWAPSVIADFLI